MANGHPASAAAVRTQSGEEEAVHELVRAHHSSGRALLYSFARAWSVEVSASGSWLTCSNGRRYLDLGSYGVFLLGHGHRAVTAAVAEQLGRLAGSTRAFPHEPGARAAAELAAAAPEPLTKVMLLNSGTEATEAAIKLARARTGRVPLAHLEGSFHGKTTGALSLTDAEVFRSPAGPLLESVRLPRDDPAAAAERVLASRPAAVFAEPVQGEGGVRPVGADLLAALRAACVEVGALLVVDEVQSGLGRCGELWAHTAGGVVPDMLLAGKALGGGVVPVSALVATADAYRPFDRDPLLHTSTFGGNPLASAAALATLRVVRADGVPDRARDVGDRLAAVLTGLAGRRPDLFAALTGRGAFLGLRCTSPRVAGETIRTAIGHGLLLTPCITTPSVLRFTPSCYLTGEELGFAADGLERTADEVAGLLG